MFLGRERLFSLCHDRHCATAGAALCSCLVLVPPWAAGLCAVEWDWFGCSRASRSHLQLLSRKLWVWFFFFFFKASLAPSLLYLSPVPTWRAQAQVSASINCPIFLQQLYNEAVLKIGREGSAWARGPSGCGGESSSRAAAMIGVCKCNQPWGLVTSTGAINITIC